MQMVTMENAEEYVESMFDFCMHTGIQKQMEAFKGTLNLLFIYFVLWKTNFVFRFLSFSRESLLCKNPCFCSSEGFNRVFPMEKLSSFSPKEVQMILCGNQSPSWNADDIINYTEPKLGYTRDRCGVCFPLSEGCCRWKLTVWFLCSPGFQRFIRVLCGMSSDERKAFLQFTTGCSTLPPGGLANLHPRLTIVRKVGSVLTAPPDPRILKQQ